MKESMKYPVSFLISAAIGLLTLMGQKILPDNLNFLANSGAVWMIPAFFMAFFFGRERKQSVVIATLCLLGCVSGYYVSEAIVNAHGLLLNYHVVIWLVCSFIGGLLGGLAGYYSRQANGLKSRLSSAFLPAVFLAEGIDKLLHPDMYGHIIYGTLLTLLIGLLLYPAISRKECLRREQLLALCATTAMGLLFYELLYCLG
ncbi:MAG: DUF6518 family protein [Erysipelotrichaceae bacterium]|nr:DUF6518 family protein [Erysipelotrichaceae bacterium]